jgi:hypothetical protein
MTRGNFVNREEMIIEELELQKWKTNFRMYNNLDKGKRIFYFILVSFLVCLKKLFLLLYWVGVHCGIYKTSYIHQICHNLNLPPPPCSFILPPPSPEIVSTNLIFPFTYLCTQYLHHIHPPTPFLPFSPLPLLTTPATQARPVPPTCSLIL